MNRFDAETLFNFLKEQRVILENFQNPQTPERYHPGPEEKIEDALFEEVLS